MNYIKAISIFLLCVAHIIQSNSFNTNSFERPIVVVICSYNNEKWTENTLNSVFTQEYTNFRVIIVDDCSSDNNPAIIQKYIEDHNISDRITFIHNTERHRKLFNLYKVLYECNDEEIVFMLDGDDYLANTHVFKHINSIYANENIWFTYGQYRNEPASQAIQWGHKEMGYCRAIPKHIQRKRDYRNYSFVYMHPRSFRAWLFKLVKLEDLIADKIEGFEGDFYPASNDVAMYFPMVEMAHTHIKFIPEILYIRNLYSEIVGFKVDRKVQTASAKEIRQKNAYPVLFQPKKNRLAAVKTASADIFLFCKNSLDDIEPTIENIKNNTSGTGIIHVFFLGTEENKKVCRTIKKNFPHILFLPYDVAGPKNLKNRILNCLSAAKNNHIVVTTDSYRLAKPLHLSHYIFWLEKTYAYRFYFNRHSLHKGIPQFIHLTDEICAYKFSRNINKWKDNLNQQDIFLTNKVILYEEIKNMNFVNIYTFLQEIQSLPTASPRIGLFPQEQCIKAIA